MCVCVLYIYIYIYISQRQQCGVVQRERGVGVRGSGQRGEKWGWNETLLGMLGSQCSV